MSIIIRIPGSLKEWLDNQEEAVCRGNTIQECFNYLENNFPGFCDRIIDDKGEMSNVLIFLNGENIRNMEGLDTKVNPDDEIGIIPLAAGG